MKTILILSILLAFGGCAAFAPQTQIDTLMGKPVADASILWGSPATHAPLGDSHVYTWRFAGIYYDGRTMTTEVTLWTDKDGVITRNKRWKGWR